MRTGTAGAVFGLVSIMSVTSFAGAGCASAEESGDDASAESGGAAISTGQSDADRLRRRDLRIYDDVTLVHDPAAGLRSQHTYRLAGIFDDDSSASCEITRAATAALTIKAGDDFTVTSAAANEAGDMVLTFEQTDLRLVCRRQLSDGDLGDEHVFLAKFGT
jgi:hypothetical protein